MNKGVSEVLAIDCGIFSKTDWRSSKTKGIQIALNDAWLKQQGLFSLRDLGFRLPITFEPPMADPHDGWCGG